MRLRDIFAAGGCSRVECDPAEGGSPIHRSLQVVSGKALDPTEMSASAIINTDAVDYENAVIYADGVRTDNYAMNPVVLWEHGLNPNVPLPIGSSEYKGQLFLNKSEFEIEAKTFFAQNNPFAIQVYGLIDEGVIRAESIQVVPIKKSKLKMPDGNVVNVTDESDMAEHSWCCLGVNPEAIKRSLASEAYREAWFLQADHALAVLEKGSIGTDRLLPEIKSSLASLIPNAKASSPGFNFDTETTMSKKTITADAVAKMGTDELKAIVDDDKKMAEYDEASKALLKGGYKKAMDTDKKSMDHDDDEDKEKDDHDDHDDEGKEKSEKKSFDRKSMKPVAQELLRLHEGLTFFANTFAKRFDSELDETTVTKSVLSTIESIADERTAIEGAFAELYSDYPPLSELSGQQDEDGEDSFQRELKSILSGDQRANFRTVGVLGRLSNAIENGGLTGEAKHDVEMAYRAIDRISTEAKSFVPPAPEGMISKSDHEAAVAAEVAKREEAEEALAELTELCESEVLPAT